MDWPATHWPLPGFRRREEPFSLCCLIFWSTAFRVRGLAAGSFYEDYFYLYLWHGYRLATTGSPYGAAPEEFFVDPSVAPAMHSILDRINYPELPTIYFPVDALHLPPRLLAAAR